MAKSPVTMQLSTPLPEGKLLFVSMSAREELGRLFELDVLAMAEKADIDVGSLLGQPASVKLELAGDKVRHFHGLICAMGCTGQMGDGVGYRLLLRPWLWLLTRRADNRIFQKKSVVDVLKDVFKNYKAEVDYSKLSGSFAPSDYCVQYRETDFNFVSRLMEHEGIYYFFKHEAGKHTLVLVNDPGGHQDAPNSVPWRYRLSTDQALDEEVITRWVPQLELQPGKYVQTDYNFETPKTSLLVNVASAIPKAQAALEIYDYPVEYTKKADGERYAKLRMQEGDTRFRRISGAGALRPLACGYLFTLKGHPGQGEDGKYLALATQIEMGLGTYESGGNEPYFRCLFNAAPSATPFRTQRITPKPSIAGPHTAEVVGPKGEEIHVDKYGRVKVQFHWDREGKKDADSSCWVRVSQPSAGKGWGAVWLPRIGQEVVVDFLEGDPDRPLITGRVYNAEQMPPYELPANKTVSTLKSRSTKGGGAKDFNEMRFQDEKGKEYLLMQAQKDQIEFVKNTKWTQIDNEQHHTVKKKRKQKIEDEDHLTVLKDRKVKIDGKYHEKVAKDIMVTSGAKHNLKAAQDITAEAGTAYSVKAGTDVHVKAGMNIGVDGGMNLHLKGGMNVVIEAGLMLTLKAGSNSVVLGPAGVSITGTPLVMINSGGGPGSGSGASPVAPTAPDSAEAPDLPSDPLPHF